MKKRVEINTTQLEFIRKALEAIYNDTMIHIYAEAPLVEDRECIKFEVSWGCSGAQSFETAREYGETLVEAANIAEKLQNMNFVLYYERMLVKKVSQSYFNRIFPYFTNAVRYMRADDITRYLDELTELCEPLKEV